MKSFKLENFGSQKSGGDVKPIPGWYNNLVVWMNGDFSHAYLMGLNFEVFFSIRTGQT
jgi:hypothetical protein